LKGMCANKNIVEDCDGEVGHVGEDVCYNALKVW
jgi:hypothetical protein